MSGLREMRLNDGWLYRRGDADSRSPLSPEMKIAIKRGRETLEAASIASSKKVGASIRKKRTEKRDSKPE